MIPFAVTQEGDKELIELAFSKKKADERKEWLRQFRVKSMLSVVVCCLMTMQPGTYLDHNMDEIPFSDFINKELILFSMADNVRSIPSAADGLKPGQRKVIWGCFKRKLKKEIKVGGLFTILPLGAHCAIFPRLPNLSVIFPKLQLTTMVRLL